MTAKSCSSVKAIFVNKNDADDHSGMQWQCGVYNSRVAGVKIPQSCGKVR